MPVVFARRPGLAAALAIALATLAAGAPATAAPSAAETNTREAKALGRAGLTLYDKGDYAGALENFKRAYAMYPAPTLGVFTARSLAKLGRLLEARELYTRVVATPLERGADETFKKAIEDARREGPEVARKIPTLMLHVKGAAGPVSATLDDKPLTPDASVEIDPGDHKIEASAGQRTVKTTVSAGPGDKREVAIDLTPPPEPVAAPPPPPPASSPLRPVGWIALATGGAGLLAGGGLGIGAIAEKGSLDNVCKTPTTCAPSASGKVDTYNTLRTASAVALYVGAGVAAVGVVILVATPSTTEGSTAIVVEPTGVHLRRRF